MAPGESGGFSRRRRSCDRYASGLDGGSTGSCSAPRTERRCTRTNGHVLPGQQAEAAMRATGSTPPRRSGTSSRRSVGRANGSARVIEASVDAGGPPAHDQVPPEAEQLTRGAGEGGEAEELRAAVRAVEVVHGHLDEPGAGLAGSFRIISTQMTPLRASAARPGRPAPGGSTGSRSRCRGPQPEQRPHHVVVDAADRRLRYHAVTASHLLALHDVDVGSPAASSIAPPRTASYWASPSV